MTLTAHQPGAGQVEPVGEDARQQPGPAAVRLAEGPAVRSLDGAGLLAEQIAGQQQSEIVHRMESGQEMDTYHPVFIRNGIRLFDSRRGL
jgi:hypothetical protein